jgi:YVTN family beta-propeller protein
MAPGPSFCSSAERNWRGRSLRAHRFGPRQRLPGLFSIALVSVGLTSLLLVASFAAAHMAVSSTPSSVGRVTAGTGLVGSNLKEASVDDAPFSASRDALASRASDSDPSILALVASVRVGSSPDWAAYDAAKGQVFVTNVESRNVSVINDTTDTVVATVPVGTWPSGAAYDPAKGEVFVANAGSANVSVINDTTDTVVATVPVGSGALEAAYDVGKGEVFVTNDDLNNVSVINDTTNKVVATVQVGFAPVAAAYDVAKGEVFVTNYGPNTVSVINDTNDTVVATIAVGSLPGAAIYDAAKGDVFIVNWESNDVNVINDTNNTVVETVPVGTEPDGAAYDPARGAVLVTDSWCNYDRGIDCQQGNISVINDTTDMVVATVPIGPGGAGIAYDAAKGEMFVTLQSSNSVSVIRYLRTYAVSFTEVGLQPGTEWWVNVSGQAPLNSRTTTIATALPNGSYAYTVSSQYSSWVASPGAFQMNGTTVSLSVPFTETYTVAFTEAGLPAKVLAMHGWTMELNGDAKHSTSESINFTLPNGTYPYLVAGPAGYVDGLVDYQPSGALTTNETYIESVNGYGPYPISSFEWIFEKKPTVTLTFAEKGLPKGQPWCVVVAGWQGCSTKTTDRYLNLTPSGTYSYAVVSPLEGQNITQKVGKITTYGPSGTVALAKSTTVHLTFAYRYAVTFTETGTPAGTWSVTIKGHTLSNATGDPIVFYLVNGTYAYKIGAELGYRSQGLPAKVLVSGGPASATVTFTKR